MLRYHNKINTSILHFKAVFGQDNDQWWRCFCIFLINWGDSFLIMQYTTEKSVETIFPRRISRTLVLICIQRYIPSIPTECLSEFWIRNVKLGRIFDKFKLVLSIQKVLVIKENIGRTKITFVDKLLFSVSVPLRLCLQILIESVSFWIITHLRNFN